MENDVLKNKIAPWQEKGRWYHGIIDTNTHKLVVDKTDDYIVKCFDTTVASNVIYLDSSLVTNPSNPSVLDLRMRFHGTTPANVGFTTLYCVFRADGTYRLALCPTGTDKVDFWVFLVK